MTEAGHAREGKIDAQHMRKKKLPNRQGLKHVALTNKKQDKPKNTREKEHQKQVNKIAPRRDRKALGIRV